MNLYRFLTSDKSANWPLTIFMSGLSGLMGGVILAIVNVAAAIEAADSPADAPKTQLAFLFVIAIAIFITAKRLAAFRATKTIERLVTDLRLRICNKLRRNDLEVVERLDKAKLFSAIAQDANLIAQSGFILINSAHQCLILVAGLGYLAVLSRVAFWLFVATAGLAFWIFSTHRASLMDSLRKDMEQQALLFSYLNHLLYGFKETKLNEAKSDEIFTDISSVAIESRQLRLQTSLFFVNSSLIADVTLYLMLGSVIFILPQLIPTYSEVLTRATVAIVFVFGPLATLVGSLSPISNANSALANLFHIEEHLDQHLEHDEADARERPSFADFQSIVLKDVVFSYEGLADAFTVGPIDLTIHRGEILFLIGGNGSGKTTLLKLIAGLYMPRAGTISVDGVKLNRQLVPAYRKLFAGVFSDFHLFDRLYGIGEIDEETAGRLLQKMEIADKVKISAGRFSTLELSTGQRKRLAMIASLLEDRQIYIFDEWTADQDPHFREQFYGSILPDLKKQGKTIIAITHDDRYWNRADRVVKLDFGRIVPVE